jgi:acetyl esterase
MFAEMAVRLRRRVGATVVDGFFRGAARVGSLHPHARPERHNVEVLRDLAYAGSGLEEHRLDIYRPTGRPGPFPVVFYVHGGGFRILSKDTHWLMALAYARQGYLVFNVSYRLAPRHPFPAAVEDVCAAYAWMVDHAAEHGGDLGRVVVAGESAGANLATVVAFAAAYPRPEPWARTVWRSGVAPKVAVPACGILQVTDTERFRRRKPNLSPFVADRLEEVGEAYLGGSARMPAATFDFADPLVALERGETPERPLPAFFLPVGTKDPILDDTRRLERALRRLGVPVEARYYEGQPHAFHAFVMREEARRCWKDTFDFLDRYLPGAAEGAGAARP